MRGTLSLHARVVWGLQLALSILALLCSAFYLHQHRVAGGGTVHDDMVLMGHILTASHGVLRTLVTSPRIDTREWLDRLPRDGHRVALSELASEVKDKQKREAARREKALRVATELTRGRLAYAMCSTFNLWLNGICFGIFGLITWFLPGRVTVGGVPFWLHCVTMGLLWAVSFGDLYVNFLLRARTLQRNLELEYGEELTKLGFTQENCITFNHGGVLNVLCDQDYRNRDAGSAAGARLGLSRFAAAGRA